MSSASLYGSYLVEVALNWYLRTKRKNKRSLRFLTMAKESDNKNKSRNKMCSGGVQLLKGGIREMRQKRIHRAVDAHLAMWRRNKAALTF